MKTNIKKINSAKNTDSWNQNSGVVISGGTQKNVRDALNTLSKIRLSRTEKEILLKIRETQKESNTEMILAT